MAHGRGHWYPLLQEILKAKETGGGCRTGRRGRTTRKMSIRALLSHLPFDLTVFCKWPVYFKIKEPLYIKRLIAANLYPLCTYAEAQLTWRLPLLVDSSVRRSISDPSCHAHPLVFLGQEQERVLDLCLIFRHCLRWYLPFAWPFFIFHKDV